METIDITSELERLDKHLAGNKRTILSAKFGDGKSYFLNEYVRTRGNEKLFITLHPVNYVVAPNEDILEYIKRDILSFLCKQPEFKEVDWEKARKKILDYDTLLEECEFLSDAIPPAKMLLTPFRLFKKVDDTYAIDKFFDRFASTKGGIFEQDEFTVAIQETIECIQQHGKECVLIIEDLDRIDPGHLFRILNVLGAHIDVEPDKNKFGFDNIILVMDYDVTRQVFHHLYGMEANYEGYMNKFIGNNVFHYSMTEQARQHLIKFLENDCKLSHELMKCVMMEVARDEGMISVKLSDFIGRMSIRDVKRVLDNVEKKINICSTEVNGYTISTDAPILRILSVLVLMNSHFDLSHIVRRWSDCFGTLELMGDFVVVYPDQNSKAIVLKNKTTGEKECWAICIERKGDNNQIQIYRTSSAVVQSDMRIHELLYRAISEATNYVIDCPHLPKYDDELEEQIYYAGDSQLYGLPDED